MRSRTPAALLALTLLSPLTHAGPTIASLAPPDSLAVIACDNTSEAVAAFKRSSLHSLWNDKQVRSYFHTILGASADDLLQPWEESGISLDEIQPPKAAVGLAFFLARSDAFPPNDPRLQDEEPAPQLLLLADYEGAEEDAIASVEEAIEKLIKQAVDGDRAVSDLLDYGEHEITRITFKGDEEEPAPEPQPAEDGDDQDVFWDDEPEADEDIPSVILITRVNDVFLASSHLDALHDAIDRIEGKDLGDAADDNPDYIAALDMLGQRADQHAYAVLNMQPIFKAMQDGLAAARLAANPAAQITDDPMMFSVFGLDQLRSVAGAIRFDTPDAAAQYTFAARVPNKTGLISLLNAEPGPFSPPPFIPADAASLTSGRINFAQVVPTIRAVMNNLPEEQRAEAGPFIEEFLNTVGTITSSLAPELHVASRISQPYSADSQSSLIAIAVKDPQTLTSSIATVAQGLFGFAPREYLGHQIWEMQGPFGGGFAFALGGAWFFAGPPASVEDALRESSNPDRPKLADDPTFIDATRAISGPAIGHSWTRLRPTLLYSAWSAENFDKIMQEQIRSLELDPEEEKEYLDMMREHMPESARTPVPADAILRHLGDMVGNLRATPEGFVGQGLFLRAPR